MVSNIGVGKWTRGRWLLIVGRFSILSGAHSTKNHEPCSGERGVRSHLTLPAAWRDWSWNAKAIAKESNDETGCVNRMIHCRTTAIACRVSPALSLLSEFVRRFVGSLSLSIGMAAPSERFADRTIGLLRQNCWNRFADLTVKALGIRYEERHWIRESSILWFFPFGSIRTWDRLLFHLHKFCRVIVRESSPRLLLIIL